MCAAATPVFKVGGSLRRNSGSEHAGGTDPDWALDRARGFLNWDKIRQGYFEIHNFMVQIEFIELICAPFATHATTHTGMCRVECNSAARVSLERLRRGSNNRFAQTTHHWGGQVPLFAACRSNFQSFSIQRPCSSSTRLEENRHLSFNHELAHVCVWIRCLSDDEYVDTG